MTHAASPATRTASAQIPVTLLTGFLGSGKTTLLNHVLRARPLTAVVMNEFGEIALDHQLLEEQRGPLALLAGGCVCCEIQGSLAPTLKNLWIERNSGKLPPFERLIIETTGIADPGPIIGTLTAERWLAARYRLDAIVTTVDSCWGAAAIADHEAAQRQIAVADRLLLTKTDLATPVQRAATDAALDTLNPGAERLVVVNGGIAPDAILDLAAWRPETHPERSAAWLGAGRYRRLDGPIRSASASPSAAVTPVTRSAAHNNRIQSFSLVFDEPLDEAGLGAALQTLHSFRAANLLRMKGLVNLIGHDRPTVLQAAQSYFYPPTELPAWPDADHRSRFVFITADLDPQFVARVLHEFTAAASTT